MSNVQSSDGSFQVVDPLGLLSRFSGTVKVVLGYDSSKLCMSTFTFTYKVCITVMAAYA